MLWCVVLTCAAALAAPPVPTADQLAWQRNEIAALTHFNMATFVRDGDPACDANNWNVGVKCSNPAVFNPVKLNVSNWVESMNALGAKHSILTAKHGCGFLLWDTKTKLPNGDDYGYAVMRGGGFPRNVLREYVDTMKANNLGHGFYYSTGNNFYLNRIGFKPAGRFLPGQANVTDAQYEQLVIEHLTELWTEYGSLTEIWFDHGYGTSLKPTIIKMLKEDQPHACGFGGFGVMPSPVRWDGTESGTPKYPMWSTGTSNGGDPNSPDWCPAGCDTTLQDGDHWFYTPTDGIRSLKELITVYHDTVGSNGLLELDFAIDRTGNVHPTHAQRYADFGGWIRSCYGTPVNHTSGTTTTLTLSIPNKQSIDRVMLQEDQTYGQLIRTYTISYKVGSTWTTAGKGTSVGNKRIHLFDKPIETDELQVVVTSVAPPHITTFAAFKPCPNS